MSTREDKKCATCSGSGTYNRGTAGSCRDDGDGEVYCDCIAGSKRALKEGGTCFWMSVAGGRLLKAGIKLSAAEYKTYCDGAKFMRHEVLPNL